MRALEAQNATRTALDAFTTGKAVAVTYGLAQPGMTANVDVYRTVKVAYTTLHTARWICNNNATHQGLPAFLFMAEESG